MDTIAISLIKYMTQVFARKFLAQKVAIMVLTRNGVEMERGRSNRADRLRFLLEAARGDWDANPAYNRGSGVPSSIAKAVIKHA
jgi:hypothetical protein